MSYYDDDHTGPSTLALVDAVTGQEIADVNLGGSTDADDGLGAPSHAGGVSVQGDDVIVVDKGKVYTYSMSDIRDQQGGGTVRPTVAQDGPCGGSYSAMQGRQALPRRLRSQQALRLREGRLRHVAAGARRVRAGRGHRHTRQGAGRGGA